MINFNELLDRYHALKTKEQQMIIGTAIFLFLTIFYLSVWEPLHQGLEKEQLRKESETTLLIWMQQSAEKIKLLRSSGGNINLQSLNQPISLLVERSAVTAGIKNKMSKLETSSSKSVRAKLDEVDFNQMLIWLNSMNQQYSIYPSSINIERSEETGLVNARITFSRS